MSASTVLVKNISSATSEKEIKEFFSFCGKIASIEVTKAGETQDASVTFEKETAAKTALLLDNTQLGATQVKVASATGNNEDDGSHYTHNAERDSDEITQEEKPRSRIIAEYLANGYVVGNQGIQRAIDLDEKHGVSSRFLSTLTNLDQKYHATDKAKSVDQSYGVTQKASSLLSGLTSYYEKAAGTPTGQKLVNFYSQTQKQVLDIHNEAARLAEIKKQEAKGGDKTTCKCGGNDSTCKCQQGNCACSGCSKSLETLENGKTKCGCSGKKEACACTKGNCSCKDCPDSDVTTLENGKTKCGCKGKDSACSCTKGNCACSDCPRSDVTTLDNGKTKCGCSGNEAVCSCTKGNCACADCPKSDLKSVGQGKTQCGCSGDEGACSCSSGSCVCKTCPKSSSK